MEGKGAQDGLCKVLGWVRRKKLGIQLVEGQIDMMNKNKYQQSSPLTNEFVSLSILPSKSARTRPRG